MKTIASIFEANSRNGPSFDMIRLFAALMVMVSHSFLVTGTRNPVWTAMTRQVSPGGFAVAVFFMLSGFVILESCKRDPRPLQFARKRILRIYPALAVVVFCTALLLAPALTDLPLSAYFTDKGTSIYLLSAIFPMREKLPGVFDNAPAYFMNGSLWTLRYEILCYAVITLFGAALIARRNVALGLACALVLLSGLTMTIAIRQPMAHGFAAEQVLRGIPLFSYFFAGVGISLFSEKFRVNAPLIAGAAVVAGLSFHYAGFYFVFPFVGAYLVVVLGNTKLLAFPNLRRGILAGDFSYGTYIIAFPVQQTVRYCLGGACTWWMDLLIAVPITLCLAMLSWHFIEKPCLRLKYTGAAPIRRAA